MPPPQKFVENACPQMVMVKDLCTPFPTYKSPPPPTTGSK